MNRGLVIRDTGVMNGHKSGNLHFQQYMSVHFSFAPVDWVNSILSVLIVIWQLPSEASSTLTHCYRCLIKQLFHFQIFNHVDQSTHAKIIRPS